MQVEPELTQQHYVKGLNNLADLCGELPLSDSRLRLCLKLASGLGRHTQPGYAMTAGVKLPDTQARLCPIEHLYYVEPEFAEWLSEDELPDAMHCLHKDISPELATKLNVQSVRQIHEVGSTLSTRDCLSTLSCSRLCAQERQDADEGSLNGSKLKLNSVHSQNLLTNMTNLKHPSMSINHW